MGESISGRPVLATEFVTASDGIQIAYERIGDAGLAPVMLVHGQRDITCPPESAWALHQTLPGSTLEVLRSGGHLSGEAVIQDALLRAADAMADTLGAPQG